ncbi:MAG: hypothetical protein IT236_17220 [Bacteroidia bacterium]|nr:hypothetical protein [Bacteroidia bacterium]
MTKEELRKEVKRFMSCDHINDSKDLIKIYTEFFFRVIRNHQGDLVNSLAETEAKLINQMMLTKALHLQGVTDGVSHVSTDGSTLNQIIDPTIVASLTRNVFETVGMFNLIFINTKSADEKTILYNLWVIAGLKYRQRFTSVITKPENFQKAEDDKKQIADMTAEIEATNLYKNLSTDNQDKIKNKLKEKDYKIQFVNNNVLFLHWQELATVMGVKQTMFDNAYTYFSLYAHPSNVAVFQFRDMFKSQDDFLSPTNFNLKYFFALSSIFISDYIKLFPQVIKTFESLPLRDQIVINFYIMLFRGHDDTINDSWKVVN